MSVKLRAKKLKPDDKGKPKFSLYLDIYRKKERKYIYLQMFVGKDSSKNANAKDREQWELAEAIRAKTELELKNNEYGFTSILQSQSDFLSFFLQENTNESRTSVYVATYKHLQNFVAVDKLPFSKITPKFIEDFIDFLGKQNINQNSILTYITALKTIFFIAIRKDLTKSNPFDKVKMPSSIDCKRDFLTIEEVRLLANSEIKNLIKREATANSTKIMTLKNAFLFACFTGLRVSDIYGLKWENIKDEQLVMRQEKTTDFVSIPLHLYAKSILADIKDKKEYIFKQDLFSVAYTGQTLLKWGLEVLGREITWHVARHTFATLNISAGTDIYTVSKLLGHRDITTTQIYAKIIDEKRKQAIDNLPSI